MVIAASSVGDLGTAVMYAAGAIATIIGGYALRGKRAREMGDPEDQPVRLRERITVLETRDEEKNRRLTDLEDEVRLYRAVQVADEVRQPATSSRRRREQ